MKKILILAFGYLWFLSVCGQEVIVPDGTFGFEEGELFIRHYQTKEEIEHKVLTDTAFITPDGNFHLQNIFLEIKVEDGQITEVLMPDRQRYRVEADILQPMSSTDEKKEPMPEEEKAKYLYIERDFQPFQLKVEGDKLIFEYLKYNFGQTGINFTMEAQLTVTMTKQENNETNSI